MGLEELNRQDAKAAKGKDKEGESGSSSGSRQALMRSRRQKKKGGMKGRQEGRWKDVQEE